jgi:hypothetical protein
LEGRAGTLRVVVGVDVLFAPPMFVTGSSVVVDDDLEVVAFPDLMLLDGDGWTDVVANVLP